MMIFQFMRAITLYVFSLLDSIYTSCMFPFQTIFALENSQIHIYASNSKNIATNVKAPVNETLSFGTSLNIPDIDPNDGYIRL